MFNFTVIKLKDIIKIGIILILIYVFSNFILRNLEIKKKLSTGFNSTEFVKKIISKEMPQIDLPKDAIDEEDDEEYPEIKSILNIGFNGFLINNKKQEKINDENQNIDNNEAQEQVAKEEQIQEIKQDVSTEVVTTNPLADKYNREYNGVKIKNETDFELTDDILNSDNLNINSQNVLIFHTHTCESYTQSEQYYYEPTGTYRTTDLNYSVARVGDELEKDLINFGFNVNHDKTYHDYPAYTGSYSRSLATVQRKLKDFNSDIIIDLHRDAIGSNENYAPTVKIGEDYCAQLMFVMGTNGGGLSHSNWDNNLKFAVKVQQMANEKYPGFFKPIILRNSRYNQQLGKAACIIEVGATGNTLEQAINSMKYLAQIIKDLTD